MTRQFPLFATLLLLSAGVAPHAVSQRKARPVTAPDRATYTRLAAEAEENLSRHVLGRWFPAALDAERGGFHQNFRADWTPAPDSEKSIVYQARLTWMAAQAAQHDPAHAGAFRASALHGLKFLKNTQWDAEKGGFFWAVDTTGKPLHDGQKHAYGISFGIYAAATAYVATKDADALDLAKRGFRWLDGHAHDAKNGGYFEALNRDGTPQLTPVPGASPTDFIGTRVGYKSMNTSIHLLEAFTALHAVWPDALLKKRLDEVFHLVRDRVAVAPPGCLHLYFRPDWTPVPDLDSFGHDIETAFLLTEAAAGLGIPDDAATWKTARALVDHALDFGWDEKHGGFYDTGTAFGPPRNREKVWWVEAEGLNALLWMHKRFGRETPRYWDAFLKQWEFIQKHQVDAQHGGWHPEVEEDGTPHPGRAKSDAWTEAYHQGRALLNVAEVLRELADAPGP